MAKKTFFTSEHVSPGHPDKVMDTIAESFVDFAIKNKLPRVAVDGLVKNNLIFLAGELTTPGKFDVDAIVKKALRQTGYDQSSYGFAWNPVFNSETVKTTAIFSEQSADIAMGVDKKETGSGDIGIMFGGAVREAPDHTCWSHYLSRLLSYELFNELPNQWRGIFGSDQKTQVTIEYTNGIATGIAEVVACLSHSPATDQYTVQRAARSFIKEILKDASPFGQPTKITINPTGSFSKWGPEADSGAVGRKIVCDQYGGYFPVGGGNLNGKDATKTDRTAVYMARYVAKQIVENQLADNVQIQLAYAIGVANPVSINLECFGTNHVPIETIDKFIAGFSFKPDDMIRTLDLFNIEYVKLGMYGHIGKSFDGSYRPWE